MSAFRWRYRDVSELLAEAGRQLLPIMNPTTGATEELTLIERRPDYTKLQSGRVSVTVFNKPLVKNSGRLF